MARSRYIPIAVRCILWGRAAGRCEFLGCNTLLSRHRKTKETVNLAAAAHIIGFSEEGPRGEKDLSSEVASDVDNLMLLCQECHKTIDEKKDDYPVAMLRKMKKSHERRIKIVTKMDEDRQSHILLYGANIGENVFSLSYEKAVNAIRPDSRYPAETEPISLGLGNSSFKDKQGDFWKIESAHLRSMIREQVKPRFVSGQINHLSVFALAPQPLLMLLGFLLSDIPAADVYQLHREPQNWRWQDHPDDFQYIVEEPAEIKGKPALVLALSATIADSRITDTLGEDIDIWRVTIANPNNDFLKSREQLRQFREVVRPLLDRIKSRYRKRPSNLHVFPAVPVAIAVEMGRIVMPKADLLIRIYDEQQGFTQALDLSRSELQRSNI